LLTLGAGRPHKNVRAVIEALALTPESPPLVVGGEPDPRFPDDVAEVVEARGLQDRVFRPGRIAETDLPALYSAAEAFIFPSLIEGFGSPPLEAMACGTAVVASSASSIPEVVGDAGIIFDARSHDQLAGAIKGLLADPMLAADLRRRGFARAQQFSWDRIGAATLAGPPTIPSPPPGPSPMSGRPPAANP
jgi:glycosyltransferase involved in cell wall biosynthesis